MQAGRSAIATAVTVILLAASLAGLWFVLPGNAEIRLTGETLSGLARASAQALARLRDQHLGRVG